MILVAGATGYAGREICRRLTAEGRTVRGLVRRTSDRDTVRQLEEWGVEIAIGDVRDPASLRAACQGAQAVVSTVTTTRSRQEGDSLDASDGQGQIDLVRAARDAGVRRFVLVSFTGRIASDDPLTRAKRAAEAAMRESGMNFTILRPGIFLESWLSPALGFDYVAGRVTLYGDGTRPISWISVSDVVEYAVRSLKHPAAKDAVLELGGPEALSPLEAVRIFEEVSGRGFAVQMVPEAALRAQFEGAQDPLQRAFAALMLAYASGCEIPPNHDLGGDLPKGTVREYARAVAPRVTVPPPSVG
jgi:uncharacterized protein YbjT (DUF2867 family)